MAAAGNISKLQTMALKHAPFAPDPDQFGDIFLDEMLHEIIVKTSITNDRLEVLLWLQAHNCNGCGVTWQPINGTARNWAYAGDGHLEILDWMRYQMTVGGRVPFPRRPNGRFKTLHEKYMADGVLHLEQGASSKPFVGKFMPVRQFAQADGTYKRMQFSAHWSIDDSESCYGMINIHRLHYDAHGGQGESMYDIYQA